MLIYNPVKHKKNDLTERNDFYSKERIKWGQDNVKKKYFIMTAVFVILANNATDPFTFQVQQKN